LQVLVEEYLACKAQVVAESEVNDEGLDAGSLRRAADAWAFLDESADR